MTTITLMYHDVTEPGREDASGFAGADAGRYKVTPKQFDEHLHAIARMRKAVLVEQWHSGQSSHSAGSVMLTFDDGGASAEAAAERLEAFGWRGHFFITTDCIARPGFLTAAAIRRLSERGHVIGSHSCTHPWLMSRCPSSRLREEWVRSIGRLEDITGERIQVASVPGGDCSAAVAGAAADSGVRFLFISRPTLAMERHGDMLVLGRYAVRRSTTARRVGAVASGAAMPRLQQLAWWDAKRICKAAGGTWYLAIRAALLGRSDISFRTSGGAAS